MLLPAWKGKFLGRTQRLLTHLITTLILIYVTTIIVYQSSA